MALSPEITFKSTPWSAKYRSVLRASGRILSLNRINASGSICAGNSFPENGLREKASSKTRCPEEEACSSWLRKGAACSGNRINSVAPIYKCPVRQTGHRSTSWQRKRGQPWCSSNCSLYHIVLSEPGMLDCCHSERRTGKTGSVGILFWQGRLGGPTRLPAFSFGNGTGFIQA